MSTVLILTFVGLLILNVPVVYCMMISSLAALLVAGVNPIMVGLEMSRSMAAFFPFLAVPFFILAGDLMNKGGLSRKITDFANALVGPLPGGLAMVTTLSAQLFGAISGASSATCVAIGKVMIPAMEEKHYPRAFSSALAACSGTTGALIPPSIVLLIYGTIAGVSVEKLFLGGVMPGVLMGLGLMGASYLFARRHRVDRVPWVGPLETVRRAAGAALPLLLVVIIFGGILGGVFTATEASAVAVVYALLVSMVFYRELPWRELPRVFISAGKTTATLSFLICAAGLFSWVLAIGQLPQALAEGLLEGCHALVSAVGGGLSEAAFEKVNYVLVLIVLNIILLIIGMFVDAGPALLIVVPVLFPVGQSLGMNPVHFGVMLVSNLVIGLVTPPVGTTLFVASGVGEVRIAQMVPHVLRFLPVMIFVQLLITFVPPISTFLPGFIK